ncbi:carbohydrate ABC transporter permease [Treponema sp.]|uniref:carbohydrate ABC transporter permease n=1 Tax=Treponema sp. TaxID=166 RepID=UPI00298E487F|nr:carbohydrate ABC transporter permease [Treponema sp.]
MDYKASMTVKKTVIYILMVFFVVIALVPIYLMLINATRSTEEINAGLSLLPSRFSVQNWNLLITCGSGLKVANVGAAGGWQAIFNSSAYAGQFIHIGDFIVYFSKGKFQVWKGMLNSIIVAVGSTGLGIYFSALTAYSLHVYNYRGRKFIWAFILFVMMLPASISFIGFYQFMSMIHLTNSFIPLTIPAIASAATVLFMRQYMASVLSLELIDAGRIDGAGEFRIFNQIIVPILQPALATQAIFGFVGSWNNFVTPMILLQDDKKKTLPIIVQLLRGDIYRTEFGAIYMGIAVSLVPIIIFYCFMSRYIISGLTMGSVKE